jgi:HD-GYP domain-containing protein (c-di-GMP phosphodiesterase class II)
MDIRNFGTALTKLMSESRNIKTIRQAEEKILYHLWNTSPIPSVAIYAMRHVPTLGAYVLSHRIGNGVFTDVILPKSLDSVKYTEQGHIIRIPEDFPTIPPFKEHRFYTLFPVHSDDYPLYIIMFESPSPLQNIYINFAEEYLSQAKRLFERTTYSYVIDISKRAYEDISTKVFANINNTNKMLEIIARILLSDKSPISIILTGNKEHLEGLLTIKKYILKISITPDESMWKHIQKHRGAGISLIKKWDIPSHIFTMLKSLSSSQEIKAYLNNLSYGIVGTKKGKQDNIFILGLFTTYATVPFTETDARTVLNTLSILKMGYTQKKLQDTSSRQLSFIKSAISTFAMMLDTTTKEDISMWDPIKKIAQHFNNIIGLYTIKDKNIVILKEAKDIDIKDVIYRLQKRYTSTLENGLLTTKLREIDTDIIIIHKQDLSPIEKQAIQAIFRNLHVVKDYLNDIDIHTQIIKRLSIILPTAMEDLGVEPKGQTRAMLDIARKIEKKLPINNITLRLAVVFHDIGKLYIPPDILLKQSSLTQEDWNIIKAHPIYSQQFVSQFEELPTEVGTAVLYHHENYDGSGYPHGLIGEEIPLLARILRVLDTYTAMTLAKAYGSTHTPEEAITHLEEYAGIYYDPEIVKVVKESLEPNPSSDDDTA